MRWRTVTIVAAGMLLAADPAKDDEIKKEQEKLKGTWIMISSEKSGKPHDDTKNAKFIFAGDKLTIKLGEEDKGASGFVLDPSKNPKWITGRIGRGIYELDGDKLKICSAEERPGEFVSKPGSNVYLYVLKREKP